MARSLFSQLQDVLAVLWLIIDQRRQLEIPKDKILAVLEVAEEYASNDPEEFDELIEQVREVLKRNDAKALHSHLQELAEMSRTGATIYR
jgi:hypothetical protein